MTLLDIFNYVAAQPSADAQWAALEQAQIAGAANLHVPQYQNTWDTRQWTIEVAGANASGLGKAEALRNWLRAARVQIVADTPQGHAVAEAIEVLESPRPVPVPEARAAAQVILAHRALVQPGTAARAAAVLNALAAAAKPAAPTAPVAA